jgi:hypothetical protein
MLIDPVSLEKFRKQKIAGIKFPMKWNELNSAPFLKPRIQLPYSLAIQIPLYCDEMSQRQETEVTKDPRYHVIVNT